MKKYRRIDWNDRLLIEKLYNKNRTCSYIAQILGFSPSSVYREVNMVCTHISAQRPPGDHSATLRKSPRTMPTTTLPQRAHK